MSFSQPALDRIEANSSGFRFGFSVQFRVASASLEGNSATAKRSFSRIVLALSGGTSHRRAAARSGRVWVLLERNPPNRPLAPVGTPASGRESNPAPHKTKRN
jgi:hypothetical protein